MGKKEEADAIVLKLQQLGKTVEAINALNNKVRTTVVKEYIPGAEYLASSYISDSAMLHFNKSAKLAQEMISTSNEIAKCLQTAVEAAQRLAIAELKAKGINIKK